LSEVSLYSTPFHSETATVYSYDLVRRFDQGKKKKKSKYKSVRERWAAANAHRKKKRDGKTTGGTPGAVGKSKGGSKK